MKIKKSLALLAFAVANTALAQSNLENPQGWINLLNKVVKWISAAFWAVAVIFVFWTAYLYLTAGGDETKVSEAHQQLKYTLIAMAVALLATVFPSLIQNFLSGS